MVNLLLLDLDGTCREPLSGQKFIQQPEDQKIIWGVCEEINYYRELGFIILGVTNQDGVAAGHKSISSCVLEQRFTLSLLFEMSKIYFCPDWAGKECCVVHNQPAINNDGSPSNLMYSVLSAYDRSQIEQFDFGAQNSRKPGAGLLNLALWEYSAKPKCCIYVGDREEDMIAANTAGIEFFWAEEWRNSSIHCRNYAKFLSANF